LEVRGRGRRRRDAWHCGISVLPCLHSAWHQDLPSPQDLIPSQTRPSID
jgi:hypothetical protein